MVNGKSEFQEAVDLAQRGQWQLARHLLQGIVEQNKDDDQVWLWLAASYAHDETRLSVLQFASKRHPTSQQIKYALDFQSRRMFKHIPQVNPFTTEITTDDLESPTLPEQDETIQPDDKGSEIQLPPGVNIETATDETEPDPENLVVDMDASFLSAVEEQEAGSAEPQFSEEAETVIELPESPVVTAADVSTEDHDLVEPHDETAISDEDMDNVTTGLAAVDIAPTQTAANTQSAESGPMGKPPAILSEPRPVLIAILLILFIIGLAYLWTVFS